MEEHLKSEGKTLISRQEQYVNEFEKKMQRVWANQEAYRARFKVLPRLSPSSGCDAFVRNYQNPSFVKFDRNLRRVWSMHSVWDMARR